MADFLERVHGEAIGLGQAEGAGEDIGQAFDKENQGSEDTAEDEQGRGRDDADAIAGDDADVLGDDLANDDEDEGEENEAEDEAEDFNEGGIGGRGEGDELGLKPVIDGLLAGDAHGEGSDADADGNDAEKAFGTGQELEGRLGAEVALLGQLEDLRAADAEQGDFRGGEEGVDAGETKQEQELESDIGVRFH